MSMKRKSLLFLLLLVLLLPTLLFPGTVSHAGSFFDSLLLGMEKDIGYNSYQSIIAEKKVVKLPPEEEERLNSIFHGLVKTCSRSRELEFSLTVVQDDTVNAFALPAGYIFVHTGLLSFARSDGELAGVLAHEIAHVDRRHSMQAIGRQIGMSLILQLILGNHSSERQEQIARIGAVAINLTQLGYGREAEYEADHYGVQFMRQAGYDKNELLNFWRRVEQQSGGSENPAFLQLFSTHPPTSERIKRIEAM